MHQESAAPEAREYINLSEALARLRGNIKIYQSLLGSFLKSPTCLQLQEKFAQGDVEGAAMAAHGIKGMAGNLSLTALYESAMDLEQRLKHEPQSVRGLDEFNETWDRTTEAVVELIRKMEAGESL